MQVIQFEPGHLRGMVLQDQQASFQGMLSDPEYAQSLQSGGPAITVMGRDGRVLLCGGAITIWEGRALLWALIAAHAGHHFVRLFRVMRRFVEAQDAVRIEATVEVPFEEGRRMIDLLGGFAFEGRMRSYLGAGRDCDMFARVRAG